MWVTIYSILQVCVCLAAEILQANDSLTQVINLYRQLVKGEEVNGDSTAMPTLPGESKRGPQ